MKISLFDDDETISDSTWHEVPQALFLSWSDAQQYAYCAARDEDMIDFAETPEALAFYVERAASYRALSLQVTAK